MEAFLNFKDSWRRGTRCLYFVIIFLFQDISGSGSGRLCLVPQNPIYQLYATVVAFYLPLTVILILNTQIYLIARRIINRVRQM